MRHVYPRRRNNPALARLRAPTARPSPPPSSKGIGRSRGSWMVLPPALRAVITAHRPLFFSSSPRFVASRRSALSPRSLSLCVYPRVSASVPYLYRHLIVRRTSGAARFYPRSLPVIDSCPVLPYPAPFLPLPPAARSAQAACRSFEFAFGPAGRRCWLPTDRPCSALRVPYLVSHSFSQADTFFELGIILSIYDIVALLPACLTTPIINHPFGPTSHFALHLLVTIHPSHSHPTFAFGSPCSPSSHYPLKLPPGVIARPCFTISFPPCAASGAAI